MDEPVYVTGNCGGRRKGGTLRKVGGGVGRGERRKGDREYVVRLQGYWGGITINSKRLRKHPDLWAKALSEEKGCSNPRSNQQEKGPGARVTRRKEMPLRRTERRTGGKGQGKKKWRVKKK